MGADVLLDGGLTIETTAGFAISLVEHGVDMIDVSGGMSAYGIVDENPGYFRRHGREIKHRVDVQVLVTGGIKTPELAEEILQTGDADMIGIGRPLLADPAWAAKALRALDTGQ